MIYNHIFEELEGDEKKLQAALRIFETHIRVQVPYFKDNTVIALGVKDGVFLSNFCALIEAAYSFSQDPTLRDTLKAILVSSLGYDISEESAALVKAYNASRKCDLYVSESRPDGPMAFMGDWTGVFIRGDDSNHLKMEIEEALHHLEAMEQGEDRKLYNVKRVLGNLLSNFEGVNANDPNHNPIRLKSFEECVRGDLQEVPHLKMDAYKGEGAVTDPYAYLGIPKRVHTF